MHKERRKLKGLKIIKVILPAVILALYIALPGGGDVSAAQGQTDVGARTEQAALKLRGGTDEEPPVRITEHPQEPEGGLLIYGGGQACKGKDSVH